MSGAQALKFNFDSFQIENGGAYYNVSDRFSSIETDIIDNHSVNTGASDGVAADLAAEQVARQAADTALGNQISAEVSARATAVQAVQDALDVQEAKQASDLVNQNDALAAEISDRQTAVAAEAASRQTQVDGLQNQITTILGVNTPADLQNLSAIVQSFQGMDNVHTDGIAALVTRISAVEAVLNDLVEAGL